MKLEKKINYFKTYDITDLKDMLNKTCIKNDKKVAFKQKDSTGKIVNKTYLDFKKDVEALSTKLINMGLKNKPIAVMGKNSYNWAISYLAATIIGVVVPVDKESSNENVKEFLNVSESEAIIADSKYLNEISKFKDELKNKILLIDMQSTSKYIDLEQLINERK
jgi:long-chain acyl-CoA synthetase